jgi:hypothetical protein
VTLPAATGRAAATEAPHPATGSPADGSVCRCDEPRFRTRASAKWAVRSDCAACGGLAPLTLR